MTILLFGEPSGPAWVPNGAIAAYNAETDQLFNMTLGFNRPSEATWNSSGAAAWSVYRAGELRRASGVGMILESESTNGIRNNSMQGAVAGNPGTLPTNWQNVGGAAIEVVDIGVEDGIDYIDIRFSSGGGTNAGLYFEATTQIAAENGQTWTGTFWHKHISGTLPSSLAHRISFNQANNNPVDFSDYFFTTGAEFTRQQNTKTGADPAIAAVRNGIFSTTGTFDFILRIGWPQLERGAATTPIRTTGSEGTRATDNFIVQDIPGIYDLHARYSDNSESVVAQTASSPYVIVPSSDLTKPVVKLIWATQSTTSLWDFENREYFISGLPVDESEAFTLSRASNGPYFNNLGNFASVGNNLPRFAHVPYVGTPLGLRYETDAEDYYWVNSVYNGAAVGDVDSTGALPIGWTHGGILSQGGTLRVDTLDTLFGVPHIEIFIDVTNNGGGAIFPFIALPGFAASTGETWTVAGWFGVSTLAGDSGNGTRMDVQEVNASDQWLTSDWHTLTDSLLTQRQHKTRTLSHANTAKVKVLLTPELLPGQRYHRRIRILLPTMTKSGILSTPLASSESQVLRNRAAETLTLPLPAGTHDLTITLDDDSTQNITGVTGQYQVPILNRTAVKSIMAIKV